MANPMWIPSEEFDDVQKDVYEIGFGVEERNCIVQGCAGSGKSCIAMNMFVNLCARGNRKPVIVTNQRALINTYLRELRSISGLEAAKYVREAQGGEPEAYYSKNTVINTFSHGIENSRFPKDATDLFVDEAQDFTLVQIQQMIEYFGTGLKAVHFFGDDGQQIYEGIDGGDHHVSMKDLVPVARSVGGKDPYCTTLYDNWRLPPVIAKFVDQVEPNSQLALKCHGRGTELPRLLKCESMDDALSKIAGVVSRQIAGTDNYLAAVICQSRKVCEDLFSKLRLMNCGMVRRVRGPLSDNWTSYADSDGPKTVESLSGVDKRGVPWRINVIVSTAFASKGLQYDDVFVVTEDFNKRGWDENVLHQMHVALTRTQGGLIVCYTPEENMGEPPRPFVRIVESNYSTEL